MGFKEAFGNVFRQRKSNPQLPFLPKQYSVADYAAMPPEEIEERIQSMREQRDAAKEGTGPYSMHSPTNRIGPYLASRKGLKDAEAVLNVTRIIHSAQQPETPSPDKLQK